MWSNNPPIFSIYFQYIEKGYLSKQTVAKKVSQIIASTFNSILKPPKPNVNLA